MFFRPLTMGAVTALGAILNAAVFAQYPIFGLQPDILLLVMTSLILIEHSALPIIMASVCAVFMDVMFAPAIGYYSLPYAIVGLLIYLAFNRLTYNPILIPPFAAAAAWFLKDVISAVLAMILGSDVDFFDVFMGTTLPCIALNGVLMLAVYWALRLLYRAPYMTPPKSHSDLM